MSLLTTASSFSQQTTCSVSGKSDTFQDMPIICRNIRLNIMELENSDKQIVNELVYRWCRILTRKTTSDSERRVLIVDMIGSINPIRLASILKRDSTRLRKVDVVRQCKINSTFLTLSHYISLQPKLIVIYHDEFYITKTLRLLDKFLPNTKSQVLLVIPKLSRTDKDVLHLMPSNQILKADFVVDRREIGPAPPETTNLTYQKHLNQIYFQRYTKTKGLPERIEGYLTQEGLNLSITSKPLMPPPRVPLDTVDGSLPRKKLKLDNCQEVQSRKDTSDK